MSHELHTYRSQYPNYVVRQYCSWLNTLVGLGYTAVLAEGSSFMESDYRPYLEQYLVVREDEPRIFSPAGIKTVSEIIPLMVKEALSAFSLIRFPRYFVHFIDTLDHLIARVGLHLDEKSDLDVKAERLMRIVGR